MVKLTVELEVTQTQLSQMLEVIGKKEQVRLTEVLPQTRKTRTYKGRVPKSDKSKELEMELRSFLPLKKGSRGKNARRLFPSEFKKKLVQYIKLRLEEDPKENVSRLCNKYKLAMTTVSPWMKGKRIHDSWIKTNREKSSRFQERNEKLVEYLNANPLMDWATTAKTFGMSPTNAYTLAKDSKKVENMKRAWEEGETMQKRDKRSPSFDWQDKELFTYKHSQVDAKETDDAINACIEKGEISYKQDGKRFGYNTRCLPSPEWMMLLTEIGRQVQDTMGIKVTLDMNKMSLRFEGK